MVRPVFAAPYSVRMLLTGVLAGFLAQIYRRLLEISEFLLTAVYARGETDARVIVIWGVVLVLIAYQTSRLVAWDPAVASGGMAHTLAVYRRNVHHSWFRNLVANLAGGTLCLLGGASVGTETPVVQIGASMANGISHQFPPANEMERRDVMAAGAGVGFAVGFSAPVAGLLFTWWFVRSRKNFQFWAYTVFAIGIACFMTRAFYGSGPFFLWPDFCPPEKWVFSWTLALLAVLLGLVSAVFGIVYQGQFLKIKACVDHLRVKRHFARFWFFLVVFLCAGVLTYTLPMTVGSGIYLIGFFPLRLPLAFLLLIFSVKFIFSALAPAFGLPGGMMFPVLALGGLTGKILVETMRLCGTPLSAEAGMVLIVAGMAAFFATVTDMPFVAFVLLLETTHCLAFLPVIFLSVSVSMVLCRFAGIRSVYEILYERSSFSRRTPLK